METELLLSFDSLPPFSIKRCNQALFFPPAKITRTLQGNLVHVGPFYQKYQSIIEGWETNKIATEAFSPGRMVEVGCLQRLWQHVKKGVFLLNRDHVVSSLYFIGETRKEALTNFLAPEDGYISYRPLLKMMVISYHLLCDKEKKTWKLELEEV